jgi:mRNA interferase MazF
VRLDTAATGLPTNSKAQAEQVRSIDVARLGDQLGVVSGPVLARVDAALRLHLDL